ncbi:threonine dehydrogenase-like Zn-dependent dehydrogenase [Moryella indoligenes]|uniref:Threonine dehydrogenase-like Zn-dependent dehydrogenase n=1 Tax=Moryella indoligenes TaxID=371674 RepID=A0AAE4AJ44_9FIRM|nr:zinc-binding dehydrogenase [Moryella indoligenes]MDQ0151373.1 threonine dehydrogenase-like Zn-dependent dehydrogenase [Moryella indoligenes]
MRAFILKKRGVAEITEHAPEPELKEPYGAILTPLAMAPCTSDVNTVYGTGSRKPENLILGHECVARVVEVASGVRDFRPGELVAVPAITPDWRETAIQEGNDRHAGRPFSGNALGRSIPGVFAERFAIADADTTLAHIPEGVSLKDALMCVDVVTTGFTGAESAEIRVGDTVVVLGIGAIGLMAVQGAALMGAARILAVGTRAVSVRLAKEFGANEVLSYREGDIAAQVLGRTGGIGADAVIICGGDDSALPQAIDMVRYGIGRVVNLKHFPGEGAMEIPKFSGGRGMAGKTVKLELCRGGRARIERLMKMVQYGRIQPGKLVTHELSGFDRIADGLELMRNKREDLVKVMVKP